MGSHRSAATGETTGASMDWQWCNHPWKLYDVLSSVGSASGRRDLAVHDLLGVRGLLGHLGVVFILGSTNGSLCTDDNKVVCVLYITSFLSPRIHRLSDSMWWWASWR